MPLSNWFSIGDLGRKIPQYPSASKIDVLVLIRVSDVYLSLLSLHIVPCVSQWFVLDTLS